MLHRVDRRQRQMCIRDRNQVDFAHNVISLSLQKTSEYLEVPMLPMVRDVLARIRSEARTSSYVFVFRAAEKIIDVKTAFHAALRRSGLADRGFCFHDLRRTFATMLYNRGVHLTKIQRLLGHASVLTTERYLGCLLYTSPSPRDRTRSRMPSSA